MANLHERLMPENMSVAECERRLDVAVHDRFDHLRDCWDQEDRYGCHVCDRLASIESFWRREVRTKGGRA